MLSLGTVRMAEAMLRNGASHCEVARDLQIALSSVEWIESGYHPRLMSRGRRARIREIARQRRKAKRRVSV